MQTITEFHSDLTEEAKSKIPNGNYQFLNVEEATELLSALSGQRPRLYGYLERGESAGQIVALRSQYNLDDHRDNLGMVWISFNGIADFIHKA